MTRLDDGWPIKQPSIQCQEHARIRDSVVKGKSVENRVWFLLMTISFKLYVKGKSVENRAGCYRAY